MLNDNAALPLPEKQTLHTPNVVKCDVYFFLAAFMSRIPTGISVGKCICGLAKQTHHIPSLSSVCVCVICAVVAASPTGQKKGNTDPF